MCLAGIFAFLCTHGDVAVYDAAPGFVKPECGKDATAEILVVVIFIVSVLGFLPGRLILDQRTFKRADVAAAKDGGVTPAPKEPKEVLPVPALCRAFQSEIALTGNLVAVIKEITPAQLKRFLF